MKTKKTKVSFLGNCQLHNIGMLLSAFTKQNDIGIDVLWINPIYIFSDKDFLPLYAALEASDFIYHQYHSERWGTYSTKNLSQFFDLKIVPTLESFVSYPQIGAWNSDSAIRFELNFVDFRILHLYLSGVDVAKVEDSYFDIQPKTAAIKASIENTSGKYKQKAENGMVIFDYSQQYKNSMALDLTAYFTFNHPKNSQLEWLMNQMLVNAGCSANLSMSGVGELINQFIYPDIVNKTNSQYRVLNNDVKISHAAKLYYGYFDTIERSVLIQELMASNYASLMDGVSEPL